jgi:hypothetical protein
MNRDAKIKLSTPQQGTPTFASIAVLNCCGNQKGDANDDRWIGVPASPGVYQFFSHPVSAGAILAGGESVFTVPVTNSADEIYSTAGPEQSK